MATKENLQEAFAGESRANRLYLAFAEKAAADGYPQVAKLFRAAAEAETVHAHNHLRAMGGIKDTVENLETAIKGERHEFQHMYPGFLAEAEKAGEQRAAFTFRYALAVEEVHYGLYGYALAAVKAGKDMDATPIFVCGGCGHTVLGEAPDKCPICGAPKQRFTEIK